MRILLVEDHHVAECIRHGLEQEGNTVVVHRDGAAGLHAAISSVFDAIVLDVEIPFIGGIEVTKRLRLERNYTPILLLSAQDAPGDVVRGFEAGADDYLVKPFSFDVFLATLKARTRSSSVPRKNLCCGTLSIDLEMRETRRGDKVINLTRTEFSILECLVSAAGRVVPKQSLIETVWGSRNVSENNLEVFIRFLRTKVEMPGYSKLIQTERGVGYYLGERP